MDYVNAFVSSVALYSLLRVFDVWSTKQCLSKLDPEMHEINPIVAPLVKKIGFNKTMIITWVPFALVIASLDAMYAYPMVGIPILWLLFGLFHVIVAANNLEIYFRTRIFGAEAIEENTRRTIRILKNLPLVGKISFLMKTNVLNLFFTLYGIGALVLFSVLLSVVNVSSKGPIPILLFVGPPIMILDLIMFFPVMVFGALIISLRRIKIPDVQLQENAHHLTFSVEFLETVLHEAQVNGATCVQFPVPEEHERTGGETSGP